MQMNSYDSAMQSMPLYLEDKEYPEMDYDGMPDDISPSDKDDSMYYERISISELLDQCIIPTLSQAVHTVYPLLVLCLISRVICIFCYKGKFSFFCFISI